MGEICDSAAVCVLYYSDIKCYSRMNPLDKERLGKGSSREEQGAGMLRFQGTAAHQLCVSGLEHPAWP